MLVTIVSKEGLVYFPRPGMLTAMTLMPMCDMNGLDERCTGDPGNSDLRFQRAAVYKMTDIITQTVFRTSLSQKSLRS